MGAIGKQPSVDSLKLTPLSADPSTPYEGMIFMSDGTPRLEGPWVYQNGAWQQFSTGAAITTVNNLTLTPQAADPGTPVEGMLFYADGTSRAEGIWFYDGTSWAQITGLRYQEFTHKARFLVRAASTANVTIGSQVENGDSFGGVTLATNDLVLLKNQSTASENGVYVVQASGAPVRSTSYDTAAELNNAQIGVTAGTNINNTYWQTAVLTSLSDNQVWGLTPPTFSFTVPRDVYEIGVFGCSGGGGGGGANNTRGGGGGGGGPILATNLKVTPGEVVGVAIGVGGPGGAQIAGVGAATDGTKGGSTIITTAGVTFTIDGGGGGSGAGKASDSTSDTIYARRGYSGSAFNSTDAGGGGASLYQGGIGTVAGTAGDPASHGFNGSGGGGSGGTNSISGDGGDTSYGFTGGAGQSGGGLNQGSGGGGGASLGNGGNGGLGGGVNSAPGAAGSSYGGGGGGGGAASNPREGARGADGYLRISW
jgi:hypothetical protein